MKASAMENCREEIFPGGNSSESTFLPWRIVGKKYFQPRIPGKTYFQLRIPPSAHFCHGELLGRNISSQSISEEETFPAENSRDITLLLLGIHGKEDFLLRIPVRAHFCLGELLGRNISCRSISEEQMFPAENSGECTFLLQRIVGMK